MGDIEMTIKTWEGCSRGKKIARNIHRIYATLELGK
jgi:hypothetical protein